MRTSALQPLPGYLFRSLPFYAWAAFCRTLYTANGSATRAALTATKKQEYFWACTSRLPSMLGYHLRSLPSSARAALCRTRPLVTSESPSMPAADTTEVMLPRLATDGDLLVVAGS